LGLEINSGIEEELPHYQILFSVFIYWTRIERFGSIRFSVQDWPRFSCLWKEVKPKEFDTLETLGFGTQFIFSLQLHSVLFQLNFVIYLISFPI